MYYSLDEAKSLVIEAGHRLLEKGLVARTWGNISARISADEFVITPSGRGYEDLTPADLVIIKVSDASYEGNIKPSSEKILHAACYKLRPECMFIIHTHQLYASVISVAGKDFDFAPCAGYGLPGTKKLAAMVKRSVSDNPGSKSFLMQRHGAVLLGDDFDEAFDLAEKLEENSKAEFESDFLLRADKIENSFEHASKIGRKIPAYIDDFAQILGPRVSSFDSIEQICSGEDAWAEQQILTKNCAALMYAGRKGYKPMGYLDACLQRKIYLKKYSKLKETNK